MVTFDGPLANIGSSLCDCDSSEQELTHLQKELSRLISEVEVLRLLQATRAWLCNPNTTKSSHRQRSTDLLKGMNDTNAKPRFGQLNGLSVKEILFIAAIYTTLGFGKLSENVFSSLLRVVPKFLSASHLPPRWFLRNEFQIAVASAAPPGSAFKKGEFPLSSHDHVTHSPARLSGVRKNCT